MKNNNADSNKSKKSIIKTILIFIGILIISYICGYITGRIAKIIDNKIDVNELFQNVNQLFAYIVPVLTFALFIVAGCICFLYYRKAKKVYTEWNGEDEETIGKSEYLLNKCTSLINIETILNTFFFAAWIHFSKYITETSHEIYLQTLFYLSFVISMIFMIVIQRCVIELEKKINPEKKGELLAFNFYKRWISSCDEAEMLIQYKATYKAFRGTNYLCLFLWIICTLGQITFNTGLFPVLIVTIIWIVTVSIYQINVIKLENKR